VAIVPPAGAFYCFADVSGLFGREIGGRTIRTALDLCEAALEAASIVLVPGEPFGSGNHVRLSFAVGTREIERGLERLVALVGERD
jgi:aspartate aminotransferase